MRQQQLTDWMLYFFLYCFIGWCFESFYVSVFCEQRWVNRGFLTGPMLPIYGCGALVILLATMPFKDNVLLIFLSGMIAATLLEYVTGITMEAIFKVRYWDYSTHRFNFRGHICLSSSITWGFFSVLLVKLLHLPIAHFVAGIDPQLKTIVALVLAIGFTCDVTRSVMTAIDLRGLLVWVDGVKGELRIIQKRIEAIESLIAEKNTKRRKELADELDRLHSKRDMMKSWANERFGRDKSSLLKRNPGALSVRYKEALEKLRDWQSNR